MRRVADALISPATEPSGADHDHHLQPNAAAAPVGVPFSRVAADGGGYAHPPTLPRDDQRPRDGPPPPPPPVSLLNPRPTPVPGADNQVSLPPLLSAQPTAYGTSNVHSPPGPKSSSNMSLGFVVGTSTVVTGVFFILVLIIFCIRHLVKKNNGHFENCPTSPPKGMDGGLDRLYAKVPDILNQKNPALGLHFIPVPEKLFCVPPDISNHQSPSSADSESERHFSPLDHVVGLGLSAGNFTYVELARATNGFAADNLLGEGGFGYVHKGVLPTGRKIAVKQLKMGSNQGEREFQTEIETISRVHHKHLVALVGYCITGFRRLLVYEYVCNGTLEFHLHGKQQPVMDWPTRMKIAIGSAKGLAYLHEDCNPTIIHRDIKAANILLDSKYEAKVSDFGLAKFFCNSDHHVSHISTRVVGTFGYLAPEYAQSGKVSEKSDVYSYGVMLLELITGNQPIIEKESTMSLASWAKQVLETGNSAALIDPHLQGNYDAKEMAIMVSCAAACVRYSARLRPGMSQIVRALEGDDSALDLDEGIKPGQSNRIIDYHIGDHRISDLVFAGGQYALDRSADNSRAYSLRTSGCSIDKGERYYFKHRKDDQEKRKGNFSI